MARDGLQGDTQIMATPNRGLFASLFGPSRNDQFAAMIGSLAATALECARHCRKTEAQDVKGIVEFEHKADAIVDEIHELLDNSFIMRFDIPDSMRLADDLDDTLDGMRKVALHIEAYRPHLPKMRPEALELMDISEEMLVHIQTLAAMMAEPRLKLNKVRDVATIVDGLEAKADKVVSAYERKLVEEFSSPELKTLGFIAWHQLFHLLEQITDDANHCAKMILSLARKEA